MDSRELRQETLIRQALVLSNISKKMITVLFWCYLIAELKIRDGLMCKDYLILLKRNIHDYYELNFVG